MFRSYVESEQYSGKAIVFIDDIEIFSGDTDKMAVHEPIEIGLVLYPGAQLAAVNGLADLFAVADRLAKQHHQQVSGALRVSRWRQEKLNAPPVSDLDVRRTPGMLLLPPSLGEPLTPEEAKPFTGWLLEHHRAGAVLASVCTGAFLLGETGLLTGRSVTTHWIHADLFRSRFPEARLNTDRLIIDDGDIITAGGMMAWIDLGLKLVDRFLGPTIMAQTARYLLVDPPGREQSYYRAFSPTLSHGDAAVLKVQLWLQATGAKDMTISTVALHAGLEERTFLRRFRKATGLTAVDYCQRLRVGKAAEMLQFSKSSIETVAWEVGYRDPGAFRKVFARVTGLTPSGYRQRFSVSRI
jgi:transcriptional regulator GlxA family with amidase domain